MERQERVRAGRGIRTVNHPVLAGFDDQALACKARANSYRLFRIQRTSCAGIAIWPVREFTDPFAQLQARTGMHDGLDTELGRPNPSRKNHGGQPRS